jgi:hypothetical protein
VQVYRVVACVPVPGLGDGDQWVPAQELAGRRVVVPGAKILETRFRVGVLAVVLQRSARRPGVASAGTISTAAICQRSLAGAEAATTTVVPALATGPLVRWLQNVSPTLLSTNWCTIAGPGSGVRAAARSQSWPAAHTRLPARVVVRFTVGRLVRPAPGRWRRAWPRLQRRKRRKWLRGTLRWPAGTVIGENGRVPVAIGDGGQPAGGVEGELVPLVADERPGAVTVLVNVAWTRGRLAYPPPLRTD